MSVTIRWTQRAAGRNVGDTETVERTAFVDAVIAQGRVTVLSEDVVTDVTPEPVVEVEEAPKPRPNRSRFAEPEAPAVEADSGEASPE